MASQDRVIAGLRGTEKIARGIKKRGGNYESKGDCTIKRGKQNNTGDPEGRIKRLRVGT